MATVPTQVRIDENLKKTGKCTFFTAWNGHVKCNEYFLKAMRITRWTSIQCRASTIQVRCV